MKLVTHLVEKPWGRDVLPATFPFANGRRIGEVWFDATDVRLPILVKWLFTSERLSIQVHPDNDQGRARGFGGGKEECWVVIDAIPGAKLGIGTRPSLHAEALRQASLSGGIEHLMDWKVVRPGDYYYIPAGTVHAIGAGITLVEVQQNTDVTFRLYDYGRPRTLHLDDGVAVSQARPYDDPRSGRLDRRGGQQLVSGPHFELWYLCGDDITKIARTGPFWIIPLTGRVRAGADIASQGECLYLEHNAELSVAPDTTALVSWHLPDLDV